MAVVYSHIRLDKNEIFYIGIGLSKDRAYRKSQRNKFWNEIYETTPINIIILYEDIDINVARKIERELIIKYGRIDLGTGSLVNLVEGGGGIANFKRSDEQILKLKTQRIGYKDSIKTKVKKEDNNYRANLVLNTFTGIYYSSCSKAAYSINMERTKLNKMLRGLTKNKTDFIFC